MSEFASLSGATVLVTGGAGFIGSNTCHALARLGAAVRVLDNLSTGKPSNLEGMPAKLEVIEGDLCDALVVREAVRGAQLVVHLGALPSVTRSIENPLASHEANATGTLNVLVAAQAAGVSRVVYASSSSVYGNSPDLPKQEDMLPQPISPYAASKLAGEGYCQVFWRLHGLEVVVLRYFNVFGPRQDPDSPYAALIPRFLRALLAGEPPIIYGDGEQSRDFTYVDNVVQANLRSLVAPGAVGHVLNIACGQAATVNQIHRLLSGIAGSRVPPRYHPARPGEARHSLADISRARRIIGYEPDYIVEEGLRRTLRHWTARSSPQGEDAGGSRLAPAKTAAR